MKLSLSPFEEFELVIGKPFNFLCEARDEGLALLFLIIIVLILAPIYILLVIPTFPIRKLIDKLIIIPLTNHLEKKRLYRESLSQQQKKLNDSIDFYFHQ